MNTLEQSLSKVADEYRRRLCLSSAELLQQIDSHLSNLLGKMLRPRLVLLSAATVAPGFMDDRRTILLATVVEMLHNASLLHDDVVDSSMERRGCPSVNNQWGNKAAILAGDYHLAQVMQMMDEVDDRHASRLLVDTVAAMTTSELLQMGSTTLDRETYRNITCGKTARLMATCCAFGNPALEQFGMHYGMAFQLRDDLNDGDATPFTEQMLADEVALAKKELANKENNVFVQELYNMTDKLL